MSREPIEASPEPIESLAVLVKAFSGLNFGRNVDQLARSVLAATYRVDPRNGARDMALDAECDSSRCVTERWHSRTEVVHGNEAGVVLAIEPRR